MDRTWVLGFVLLYWQWLGNLSNATLIVKTFGSNLLLCDFLTF